MKADIGLFLENQMSSLDIQDSVFFTDSLDERWKWAAHMSANLFVMPSHFENFGMSIVEAMMVKKPVVTTTGTPWKQLPLQNAGWWVKPTPKSLARALRTGMRLPESKRRQMGENARMLAEPFHIDTTTNQLLAVYRWLCQKAPRPDTIRMD